MTKAAKELIVIALLLGVLAVVVVGSLDKMKEQKKEKEAATDKTPVAAGAETAVTDKDEPYSLEPASEEVMDEQKERLDTEWDRDPFHGEEEGEGEGEGEDVGAGVKRESNSGISDISLKGISWTSKKSTALINSQVVIEGESVLGYEVIDIQKDKVILRKDDKEYEIKLEN